MNPLLLLHGFWGLPSDFSPQLPELRLKKLHSLDYTKIPQLSPEIYFSDWGTQFISYLDQQFPGTQVSAVGYSQGGRLLLSAFAAQPDRFKQLILISSHPGLQKIEDREQRLKTDRSWAQKFRRMDWEQLQGLWNAQEVFKKGNLITRQPQDFDRQTLALCLENWSLAHQPDYRSLMVDQSKIEVILGEEDTKYVQLYRDLNVKVHKVKGAAHRVPSDQSIRLTEVLNLIFE